MDKSRLIKLLSDVKSGRVTPEKAMETLEILPYENLGFAKPDHHRTLRQGFPEVILAEGKTPEQVALIAQKLKEHSEAILITRASPECYRKVSECLPLAKYNDAARTITFHRAGKKKPLPGIAVISGGTADIPVAEEAAITAETMGNQVERAYDVGVAGIHRLLDHVSQLRQAHVIVAVAGMEGALPSVVAGLVSVPVIAVPTSVGYGASFGGVAALLGMLNSCAAGVSVVNIDNGFGAGYIASLINRAHHK